MPALMPPSSSCRPTMSLLVAFVCGLLLAVSPVDAASSDSIFTSLLTSYDSSTRPYFNTSTPVTIDVQFRVNLLYAVDSKNEQFSLDFFVRELWYDPRLTFDATLWPDSLGSLRVPTTKTVWKPDTFFLNAVSCTTTDTLLTLNATGRLNWSRHQTCVFKADFDLTHFPFDSQTFSLHRVSYAYTMNEVVLQPISTSTCFLPDPTVDFENSLWDLTGSSCSETTIVFRVGQDNYYEVTANLFVTRKYQNYIVKLILPMFIIVSLSTITYFIDASSTPARVGGTVTLVLSIVTFNLVVSQDLPKINYSTLLDWYVWKCFLFVVFAVGEFACVNNILTTKVIPPQIARLIDDFCAWTLLPTWCLSNLLFWPFTTNEGVEGVLGCLEIGYFGLNLYRTYWNWRHEKLGIVVSGKALISWLRARWVDFRHHAHKRIGLPPRAQETELEVAVEEGEEESKLPQQ